MLWIAGGHAIAYLETRPADRPFYLKIGTQEPHQVTWRDVGSRIPGPVTAEQVAMPLGFQDTPRMREEMGRFQASAAFMDHHFGRLMDAWTGWGCVNRRCWCSPPTMAFPGRGPRGRCMILVPKSCCWCAIPEDPEFHHGWPEMPGFRPHEALYDTTRDPQEWINLAARPEYQGVRADLAARLEQWMRDTDDFLLRGEVPTPPEAPGWGPAWPA